MNHCTGHKPPLPIVDVYSRCKRIHGAWLGLFLLIISPLTTSAREPTEWVTINWYNANQSNLPRVLLIGDSIARGYAKNVSELLAGEVYTSIYATSKSLDDPFFDRELTLVLEQYDYDLVLFNNGLHSLYADRKKWEEGLTRSIHTIRDRCKNAKLIWITITPLKDPELTKKVQELNSIAHLIVSKEGIEVIDLFSAMAPLDRDLYWSDTYHFKPQPVRMQADAVAAAIRSSLDTRKATPSQAREALEAAASDTGPDGKIGGND